MAGFKEYQMMFQLNASMGGGFQSTFSAGSTSVTQLQEKINSLNKTQSDIASYQKQQSAIEKTKAKIDLYSTQLANLQNATASTSKEEAELANAIAAKDKQLQDATAKLDEQNAALSETGQALRQAGVDTTNLASESERLKTEAQQVAQAQKEEAEAAQEAGKGLQEAMEGARAALEAAGIVAGLKSIYSALSDCSAAAAEFESSMAAVRRTTGGDDSYITGLGESFKQLSTQMPITATELANIATTAGQLGIEQGSVQQFTTVMAQLATTTDLTADNAATMLAQFSNITGVTDYDRLGATVAALGDSTATTASKVVDMSQGMAAAANIAGMSATDVLAISAAVGSLGIEAAAGSTSMSQLITKLYKATETGDQLEDIASVAGMTAEQFKQAWATDAVGALDTFIQGLNNVERNGKSAVVVLDELGINNVRQTKAILGLASAGGLLSNTISVANNAWSENSALAQKAGIMYNTTEAKLTMMGNAANNVKIAVGDALNPALGAVSGAITSLLEPIAEWLEANPAVVQGITAAIGALGLATAGIVGYTAATKLAAAASALFAGSIPGVGVILGVAAAIGVAVGVISALTSANQETAKSFSELDQEYDDMMDKFEEQTQIVEMVDQYRDLNKESKNLQTLMKGGFHTTVSVKADDTKISPDAFLSSTQVTLTASQVADLLASGFMKEGDKGITISAQQTADLVSSGFLSPNDKGITLTAKQVAELYQSGFMSPYDKGITLKASQVQDLKEKGFMDPNQGGIWLTANQNATLQNIGFMDPNSDAITLTAKQTAILYQNGFLSPDDEGITISAKQTADLLANGFLDPDDQGITLSAQQTADLVASGFLDPNTGSVVTISATTGEKIKASSFMADTIVTITGEAGNTLTAADFGISEQTLTYIATMDGTSYQDVKSKAEDLKSQVLTVNSELSTAQTELAKSQELAEALETKINNEKNRKKKTALQEQLEAVNTTIEQQQDKVDALELKHEKLSGEYDTVSTAAQELSGKEAELLAIKQQLSGVVPDVTQASEDQADAYNAEADAAERVAKARMDDLREQLYKSINGQSRGYVQSLRDEAAAQEVLTRVQERMADVSADLDNYAESTSGKLKQQYETTLEMYRAQQGNSEYTPELIANMQTLKEMMHDVSGEWYELDGYLDSAVYAEMFDNWIDDTKDLSTKYLALKNCADEYNQTVADADQTQQAFIDNLVAGVENGVIDLDQLRVMLEDSFAGEEDAAELVESTMAEVEAQLNAAAEAAEDFAQAEEEIAEMSGGTTRSVEEIIEDLKTLQKEYDEAYKAAYSSMSGQFKMFEDASSKIKEMQAGYKGGTKGMTKGLESQTSYIEQYTANFELAQQQLAAAGVSAETAQMILSGLSDGSAESGAALESIASGSTEDAKKLAKGYEDLQAAKEKYAALVAETETNFSEKLTALSEELEATVAGMDKSSEAAAAAATTLSAYVNAADGYVSLAAAKYGAVAQAAVNALKKKFGLLGLFLPGFAGGTKSAPKGMAIVGEEGPELVYFNGGETVVPADETERLAHPVEAEGAEPAGGITNNGGNTYTVTFSPQYNVESGVNADELKTVLEENSGNLREQLEELLAEIADDEKRRDLR